MKTKLSRGPGDAQALSIGALSRATRIPAQTIRTWEHRYGWPAPIRKPSGHRVYPATVVEHLRRVGRLLALGHRPGEILGQSVRELDALLALHEPGARPGAGADTNRAAARRPAGSPTIADDSPARTIRELLKAARNLDREPLMRELHAAWLRLGPVRFLEEIAGAFMVEIGLAWHAGTLDVRHEHFATACVTDFLRAAREPHESRARGPRVVAAMLPGEAHEGGLLIVATLLALRGYRVIYLGPNTPIGEIVGAVRGGGAEAVAISVSSAAPKARSARALAALRKALPHRVSLWLGGAGAPTSVKDVERFASPSALDARLTSGS